jgi:aminoglycoside phosphotransferase
MRWSPGAAWARSRSWRGLRLSGDEVFVESGSNDTWFVSGDTVLQVCYPGDVDRLVGEAELLAVLPDSVPGPAVLDYGRDQLMSWILVKRVRAGSLWDAWASEPGDVLRSYVSQLAQVMRSLHSWQPPARVLARYAAAECPEAETDPGRHRGEHPQPLS